MMFKLRSLLEGDGQIRDKFGRVIVRVPREIKNAVRRGATLQARAIKANLKRKRTGLLAKSIGSRVKDYTTGRITALSGPRRGFRVEVRRVEKRKLVGVRDGTKKGGPKKIILKKVAGVGEGDTINPTRYAHLVDKGHAKGKGKGAAKGWDFMKKAFQATRDPIKQDISRAIQQAVSGA